MSTRNFFAVLRAGTTETKRTASNKYYRQIWSSTRTAGTNQLGTWSAAHCVIRMKLVVCRQKLRQRTAILNNNTKGGSAVILQKKKMAEYCARRLIYQLQHPERFHIFPKVMVTHQSRNKAPTSRNLFRRLLKLPHRAWIWGNQFRLITLEESQPLHISLFLVTIPGESRSLKNIQTYKSYDQVWSPVGMREAIKIVHILYGCQDLKICIYAKTKCSCMYICTS